MFSTATPTRPLDRALTLAALVLATLSACSGDSVSEPVPTDTTDTGPSGRSFLLAARAEGYDLTRARPFFATLDTLTFPAPAPSEPAEAAMPVPPPDRPIEAIVLPVDLIGIPWTSFNGPDNRPGSLPAPWLAELDAMVALATATGLPLVLAVSPLADTHDTLAPLASDGAGALVLNPTWKPSCYNPSSDGNPTLHRDQFAGYVVWLAERLQPAAIIVGQRLNLYETNCGASAFDAIKGFASHAHTRLQAASTVATKPLTVVSFDVEDLYGLPAKAGRCVGFAPKDCLATRAPLLADLGVDRLGLESHPFRAVSDLSTIPRDWLAAVASSQTLPALVASTGVPAARLDAQRGACAPFIESSEADQRAWLDQVIAFSTAQRAPYLVWRTLIDPMPSTTLTSCPCSGTVADCTHLEGLGNRRDDRRAFLSSGLASSDATARQALGLWRSLLAP